MITATSQKRYTPEDLLHLPDGDRYELVDGQLVETNMSTEASYVAGKILRLLGNHCEANRLGWVLPEGTTYQCFPDAPETVRKPDVSFIRLERMSVGQFKAEGHNPIVPDLIVEVVSPNDKAYEIQSKVQEFLSAGTKLVWIVHPNSRRVDVHRLNGQGTILRGSDDLDGEDVVQGFRCPVLDLFQIPAGA